MTLTKKAVKVLVISDLMIADKLQAIEELIAKDMKMKTMLLDEAFERINKAKKKHDEMEKSYIPQMDFSAINELKSKITERIKKYME